MGQSVTQTNGDSTALVYRSTAASVAYPDHLSGTREVTKWKIVIVNDVLNRFVDLAMEAAIVEKLENNTWFAELPQFSGVWGNGDTKEAALKDLRGALREWTTLKIKDADRDIPQIGDIDLNVF